MPIEGVHNPVDIAVSGLRAQSARMSVITANIANSNTSRAGNGQPYRRKEVVLATSPDDLSGVSIVQVTEDLLSEFKSVYQPGHPDADSAGYVRMPNVDLPSEMIQLISASRAYQANAAVLKRYQELGESTLELLR
jgi:flagellar basal-body rod protein FlgC